MFLLFPILTKSNFNAFKCKQIKPKKTNTPNHDNRPISWNIYL